MLVRFGTFALFLSNCSSSAFVFPSSRAIASPFISNYDEIVLDAHKTKSRKQNYESDDSLDEIKLPYKKFPIRRSRLMLAVVFILSLFVEQASARKVAASFVGVILARICSNKIHFPIEKIPAQEKTSLSVELDQRKPHISMKKRFLDGIAARKILANLDEQEHRIEQINREIRLAREGERLEEGKNWALKAISTTKEAQRRAEEQLRREEFEKRKAKAWAASVTKTSGVDITKD